MALQALVLLIAYRYASAVESGKPIAVAGFLLEPRGSVGLLGATAVAVFVLAVTSAVLVMRARVSGASIALEYADYSSQRVFHLVSRLPTLQGSDLPKDLTTQRLLELTRRDANYWAQVLRTIAYALLHVGTVVIAGAALLYLDAYLTLVVFAILAVATLFLRKVSIRGASQRAKLLECGPERAKELRNLTARVLHNPAPLSPASPALLEPFAQGGGAKYTHVALGQRRSLEAAKLIAQIAIAGALFVVLLVQGGATLSQVGNWSSLLAYIAALSYFGTSVARVGRMLVSINRFYPPLARHARFIDKAQKEMTTDRPIPQGPYVVKAPVLAGDVTRRLQLRNGDRIALVVPGDITRHAMIAPAKALCADAEHGEPAVLLPWFASVNVTLGAGSLRENLALPASCTRADLQGSVAALNCEALVRLPTDLDRSLTLAERDALTPPAVFVLIVLSGLLNRHPLLALDHNGLVALDREVRHRLLEETRKRVTLIAYAAQRTQNLGDYGESAVIIAAGEEVLGWAWIEAFRAGEESLKRALARAASESRAARTAVYEEDDMEELE